MIGGVWICVSERDYRCGNPREEEIVIDVKLAYSPFLT